MIRIGKGPGRGGTLWDRVVGRPLGVAFKFNQICDLYPSVVSLTILYPDVYWSRSVAISGRIWDLDFPTGVRTLTMYGSRPGASLNCDLEYL